MPTSVGERVNRNRVVGRDNIGSTRRVADFAHRQTAETFIRIQNRTYAEHLTFEIREGESGDQP